MSSVAAESPSPQDAPPRVRELDIGTAIDEAVLLLRERFWLFARLVLLVMMPCMLPVVFFSASVAQGPVMMGPPPETVLLLLAVVFGYLLLVQPAIIGLLSHTAARVYTGHTPTLLESIRWLPRHLFSLIIASTLVNLGIVITVIACVVTATLLSLIFSLTIARIAIVAVGTLVGLVLGIMLYLMFAITLPAIAVEGVGPINAMSRSIELTRQNRIPILGLTLVLGVIGFALNYLTNFIPEPYTGSIMGVFTNGMTMGLQTTSLTVFYFSCRCRREHYDLQLLAERVAAGREEAPDVTFAGDLAADEERR